MKKRALLILLPLLFSGFLAEGASDSCYANEQDWQMGNKYVYLPDLQEHKEALIEKILSDSDRLQDPSYQLSRALLTIRADDADYIPKIPLAGQIIENYQLMHNGVKVITDCYYNVQWMTDVICGLKGHHEPQEEKVFYEVLKYIPENATMLELGAYWGYYSLWFSQAIPGAKNYLIEPDENRLNTGRRNFELNNKEGQYYRGYVAIKDNDDADFTGARQILIDSFLQDENIEHVNILHADIQGAEFAMLNSCIESIKQDKIDYFFVSTHTPLIHENCLLFFKDNNFHIIAEHTLQESCSADGLIVARRNNLLGLDSVLLRKY